MTPDQSLGRRASLAPPLKGRRAARHDVLGAAAPSAPVPQLPFQGLPRQTPGGACRGWSLPMDAVAAMAMTYTRRHTTLAGLVL
jgi:hypothetical protein